MLIFFLSQQLWIDQFNPFLVDVARRAVKLSKILLRITNSFPLKRVLLKIASDSRLFFNNFIGFIRRAICPINFYILLAI